MRYMILTFLLMITGCEQKATEPTQPIVSMQMLSETSDEVRLLQKTVDLPQVVGWQEWDKVYRLQFEDQTLYVLPLEAEDEARCVIAKAEGTTISYYLIGLGVAEEDDDSLFSGWLWFYDLETGFRCLTRRFLAGVLVGTDLPTTNGTMMKPNKKDANCLIDNSVTAPPLPARFYQLSWEERLERLAPYFLQLQSC